MNTDAVVIISPVDAEITAAGTADGDMVLLVKGMPYSIRELVGTDTELYDGGAFVMLYLSPADCHRIYAPCDALVTGSWFIDGRLRPVYPAAVEKYPRTFITNKRIITELRSDLGTMIMAKIGALNVGRIPVKHPLPCTEQKCFSYRKGEELGRFEFGSTIVLLFEKGRYKLGETVVVGRKIKIGEAIASSC